MEVFIVWLLFAALVGAIASSRGRSGFGFFLLSVVLSPLIGLIFVLLAKARPSTPDGEIITTDTHVRCPDCRELVRADARKCKHCGTALVPQKLAQE
jgi:hypothetical protein